MESKDISRLSSSGFKSRWKVPWAVCIQPRTTHQESVGVELVWLGLMAKVLLGSSELLSSHPYRCLLGNQCCIMLLGFRGSGMPWIIWTFWVHLFFPPAHWDDSILFCPQSRSGGGGTWVVLFCLLHVVCKVVSELTGWNWELLWRLVSISQPLKSKGREGSSFPRLQCKYKQGHFPGQQQEWAVCVDQRWPFEWVFKNPSMK